MAKALRFLGQGVVYALIAVLLGVFADTPAYVRFPRDKAQLTLSLSHGAQRKVECRRLSAKEVAALPPNMRKAVDCPRERLPVLVEVDLDGRPLVRQSLPPSGLFGDGPSQIYQNFTIPAGRHRLVARLRDSARTEGFDYRRDADIELRPRQRFVIAFRAETGGFIFAMSPSPTGYRDVAQGLGRDR